MLFHADYGWRENAVVDARSARAVSQNVVLACSVGVCQCAQQHTAFASSSAFQEPAGQRKGTFVPQSTCTTQSFWRLILNCQLQWSSIDLGDNRDIVDLSFLSLTLGCNVVLYTDSVMLWAIENAAFSASFRSS